MTDTTTKPEADTPPIGDVIGRGLLELARTGRLTDDTANALSEAYDPKPEPTEADKQAEADAAELAELRAARDKSAETSSSKSTTSSTKGTHS
jgi:hypothetical protein